MVWNVFFDSPFNDHRDLEQLIIDQFWAGNFKDLEEKPQGASCGLSKMQKIRWLLERYYLSFWPQLLKVCKINRNFNSLVSRKRYN